MNRHTFFTLLLSLSSLAAAAQTPQTATINGYSQALKDSTRAIFFVNGHSVATEVVIDGRFSLTVPVDGLTSGGLLLAGEGCPSMTAKIYLTPGVTAKLEGTDRNCPLWKVESPVPEQQTCNKIREHVGKTLKEYIEFDRNATREEFDSINYELLRKYIEALAIVPVDAASINEMESTSKVCHNNKNFPYMKELKELEASIVARAPKGFEEQLATIHKYLYPPHVLQVGEKATDAELFDIKGDKHHLAEYLNDGRYLLLDFWSLGCGPCYMSEPELREVYGEMKDRLEIVGINRDHLGSWQDSEFSKKIAWQNWNDGKMGRGGIELTYCDNGSIPYYVLIAPDGKIVLKTSGYYPGKFKGLATALRGPKQDNSQNLSLAIRSVEVKPEGTTVHLRFYGMNKYWFVMASRTYLSADGERCKLVSTDGIKLDVHSYPTQKASEATEGLLAEMRYADFALTFEPFKKKPKAFDLIEFDGQEEGFIIRNIVIE